MSQQEHHSWIAMQISAQSAWRHAGLLKTADVVFEASTTSFPGSGEPDYTVQRHCTIPSHVEGEPELACQQAPDDGKPASRNTDDTCDER